MTQYDNSTSESNLNKGHKWPFLNTPVGLALCVVLAVAGVYLWVDHRAHILGALPLLLPLALCVGMHLFMHKGHGGQKGGRRER